MSLELVPLCNLGITLDDPIVVGEGPSGLRLIYEVLDITITGDRFRGSMLGRATADWLTIVGNVGTLNIRATTKTDDGAIVFCQYQGRTDVSGGPGGALYVAPTFENRTPATPGSTWSKQWGRGSS